MTFITERTVNIPTGKTQYQSSLIYNKLAELTASGDLISNDVTVLSETQKKITMVWKDQDAFNSYSAWLKNNNEKINISNWNTANNIETT